MTVPNQEEQQLYLHLQDNSSQTTEALETVLRRPETASAFLLFLASAAALRTNRLEEGAFLFYIGQMRHRFDVDSFPHQGAPSEHPSIALEAMSYTIGQVVNPSVMALPEIFNRVLNRIRAWEPQTPSGYWPGWDAVPATTDAPRAEHARGKQETLKGMTDLATLLGNPEYLQNFRLMQVYNLGQQEPRPTEAQYEAARARMLQIEQESNLAGPLTLATRGE